jgi:hypothetical protein
MKQGERHALRLEWRPDGGVSYIGLRVRTPVEPNAQERISFWSEMGDEIDYYFTRGDRSLYRPDRDRETAIGRRRSRVVGVFPSVESYVRLTICYLIEYAEGWGNERSYIREDKVLGSLDRLHEPTAPPRNRVFYEMAPRRFCASSTSGRPESASFQRSRNLR